MRLLKDQQRVAKEHFDKTIFLEGIAGTGKTTAAIERVKNLLRSGVPGDSILVLVPQSALALPYREALRRARVGGGGVHTATFGSLAYQMVDLFYPLIAESLNGGNPPERPHFLSLELVQYYMTRFVEPEIERHDYFNSVHISRTRLYTQIVDNLNKAAVVGFDPDTISARLKAAWRGDVEQAFIYDDVQASANVFREMCRQHHLLDFSLQVELFQTLWRMPQPRQYLTQQYRHLIIDNVEEDSPATHDMLRDWLEECESALVIYDTEGGYRRFLGADPVNAYELKRQCQIHAKLDNHRVMSPDVQAFQVELAHSLNRNHAVAPKNTDAREALVYTDSRFHPQMVDWAVENIATLIHQDGVNPAEIVVLAPFLPDALRFALQTRLNEQGIPNRAHRPSRALREEPAARTLLTLAKVAHPQWNMPASKYDLAYALTASIAEFDLVRARLLVDIVYRNGQLHPFEQIQNEGVQERITFDLGNRYEQLRQWLDAYIQAEPLPLDAFFSKLFGEVLSQPAFGFHDRYEAANTAANLIDSAREFRQTVSKIEPLLDIAPEYVQMVDKGVIANLYIRDWRTEKRDSVLIAPAYTFLLSNQPVEYQFWLNVGSTGWAQRINQPLTHPYILSRQWIADRKWEDADEVAVNQESLANLALGLLRRCRKKVYLGFSEFGEQGYEQRGALLLAIHSMLRRLRREDEQHV
jgi:hypothetical protein